jgi:ferredoxin
MLQKSKSEMLEIILDDDTSRGIARNGIEITIDRKKCNYSMYDPKGCKKCLEVCPVKVYATRPIEKRDFSIPLKERVDPTQWILLPTWADWCNGCAACVEECPKDAITIQFGDRLIAP